MPRAVAEIEAEYDGLKAQGGRWWTTEKAKSLRAERDAAKNPASSSAASATPSAAVAEALTTTTATSHDEAPACDDEEMRAELAFAEKCVAEIKWEPRGTASAPVKNLYETIEYKMKAWRITRAIIKGGCVGRPWPKWETLGRDDSTGELKSAKPPKPTLVRDPAPVAPPPVPAAPVVSASAPAAGTPVTMEAMMAMFAAMQAKANDPMEQLKRGVAAEIAKSVAVAT